MLRRFTPLIPLTLAACAAPVARPAETLQPRSGAPAADEWVEATLRRLSLRQKVGQLVLPRVSVAYLPSESDEYDQLRTWVRDLGIGGVVIHAGTPLEIAAKMNLLQAMADVPLLVTADLEPGPVQSQSMTRFPPLMGIGATGDPRLAFEVGRITALEGRAQGIHVTFAPVVDVNNNPANPIINTRSYGEDPRHVGEMAAAHVRGLQEHGMLATAKHFPGHGNTSTDSHIELPVLAVTKEQAEAVELVPYRMVIGVGLGAVMSAHIAFPALTGDNIPATLNHKLVSGLLQQELGFRGVVFTDALDMGAIVRNYGSGQAAVMALKAGADGLLQPLPQDVPVVIDAIVEAVRQGEVSEERVDQSVRKLLAAKARFGLGGERFVDLDRIPDIIGNRGHQALAREVADRSITAVRDTARLLPLDSARVRRVLSIVFTDEPTYFNPATLQQGLAARFATVRPVLLDTRAQPAQLDALLAAADSFDVVLFNPFVRARYLKGSVAIAPHVADFVRQLAARRPTIVTTFGNPYVLIQFPEVATYVVAWGGEDVSQRAAVRALTGEIPITGRMPVSIPGLHRIGDGVVVQPRKGAETR